MTDMLDESKTKERGFNWKYREAVCSSISVLVALSLVVQAVVFVILRLEEGNGAFSFSAMFDLIVSLKAQEAAINLALLSLFLLPISLVLIGIVPLFLAPVYTLRDRNIPRTKKNIHRHQLRGSFAWTWPLSYLVCVFDFSGLFVVFNVATESICDAMNWSVHSAFDFLMAIVCLTVADRRIVKVGRGWAKWLPGNQDVVSEVLDGERDDELPEEKRNYQDRLKVALVLSLGFVRTPRFAARLVDGIALRTKVKLFSGFLNSAIHGILSAVSLGIASQLANELGDVNGQIASGKDKELVASLKTRAARPPRMWIELASFLLCAVATAAGLCL